MYSDRITVYFQMVRHWSWTKQPVVLLRQKIRKAHLKFTYCSLHWIVFFFFLFLFPPFLFRAQGSWIELIRTKLSEMFSMIKISHSKNKCKYTNYNLNFTFSISISMKNKHSNGMSVFFFVWRVVVCMKDESRSEHNLRKGKMAKGKSMTKTTGFACKKMQWNG